MNKFLMATAIMGAMALGSTAVLAHNHEGGDHKGKMMERVDTDGNGVVSKEEFMAKHEEMFSKMDSDDDGNLTQDEMQAAKEKMKEKWKEKREEMMEKRQEMMENQSAE